MSTALNIGLDGQANNGFTIKSVHGCRIVYGMVPASEFGMLAHGFSKKALMANDIADRIGAAFVIGEPADLEELRKLDLPVSEKRQRDYEAAHRLGLHTVAMWLRTGERGGSSNAMCKRFFGVPDNNETNHPHDPDDLRRCILFLDAADAHDKVSQMADVSPGWSQLVLAWDRLIDTYRSEIAAGKSTPKTYALMRDILGS